MKLQDILFHNVCQIPKYNPEDSIEKIRDDVETIERFSYSGFLYQKSLEDKFSSVCKNIGQYDHLRLLAGRLFKKVDTAFKL
jgi:hypothetical protein